MLRYYMMTDYRLSMNSCNNCTKCYGKIFKTQFISFPTNSSHNTLWLILMTTPSGTVTKVTLRAVSRQLPEAKIGTHFILNSQRLLPLFSRVRPVFIVCASFCPRRLCITSVILNICSSAITVRICYAGIKGPAVDGIPRGPP